MGRQRQLLRGSDRLHPSQGEGGGVPTASWPSAGLHAGLLGEVLVCSYCTSTRTTLRSISVITIIMILTATVVT